MGRSAVAFIKALGLQQIDVLGFSIGGFVAQEITLAEPKLLRRLILLGTGPRSGVGMDGGTPEGNRIFGSTYAEPDHLWLSVCFTPSQASQAAGRAFLKRFRLRAKDRDPEVNEKVAPAQRTAIAKWAAPRERPYDYLKAIQPPTLVVDGSNDVIIYTMNSFILQQNLPNAQLISLCVTLRCSCQGQGSRVLGHRKRATFRDIGQSGARSCPTSPVKPLS
jgi:pimeloyl-ACP methyl ester carboxylesterase